MKKSISTNCNETLPNHQPVEWLTVEQLTLEALAHENNLLHERVASLEADVGAYQETLHAALDGLRHVTQLYRENRVQLDVWLKQDRQARRRQARRPASYPDRPTPEQRVH